MVGRICRKGKFKPGVEEWRGNGWWKWWVDGTDGGSATQRTGWRKSGEISAWLTEGSQRLVTALSCSVWTTVTPCDWSLAPFQQVLHTMARTVLDLQPRDRVTLALQELLGPTNHWEDPLQVVLPGTQVTTRIYIWVAVAQSLYTSGFIDEVSAFTLCL